MRVGIVVPHFFMNRDILSSVIFSPAKLAINLSEGLTALGADITLFSPGNVDTSVKNINVDLSYFDEELSRRGYSYIELLKKHPLIFVSLARQAQSEIIAKAYEMANNDELDVIHIYTNEEDIALPFSKFCKKPVFFTHHDPFSYLIRYKNIFPKYKSLNWISLSYAQRKEMPLDTNWVANIYHGIAKDEYSPKYTNDGKYIAYIGRIIKPKGVHLAIKAIKKYNKINKTSLKLKIAGKHYADFNNDQYWNTEIKPEVDNKSVEFIGMIDKTKDKEVFLQNAKAIIMPSVFNEPFGLVMIESLACSTPVIALNSGAIPEVITAAVGELVNFHKSENGEIDEDKTTDDLAMAIKKIDLIDRKKCRQLFDDKFTLERMCQEHLDLYELFRI
jgi:glycosyltransferase involved in cell wall biosynthesis